MDLRRGNAVTLSTHVLDTATGVPAAGVAVTLYRLDDGARSELTKAETNADGRVASPFGGELADGWYELVFEAGDYYGRANVASFYDEIAIRFVIEDGQKHYHVPLLLSPWGYSTYRGS
jgi:5-hydroxyisourate hydrolase